MDADQVDHLGDGEVVEEPALLEGDPTGRRAEGRFGRMLTEVVVLPAPLGPSSATSSPGWISRSTPWRASTFP